LEDDELESVTAKEGSRRESVQYLIDFAKMFHLTIGRDIVHYHATVTKNRDELVQFAVQAYTDRLRLKILLEMVRIHFVVNFEDINSYS
jgi:hypothetical protein